MPAPSPSAGAGRPGRRTVLIGLAATSALLVSGCGDLGELRNVRLDDDEPYPEPSPGPDELARRAAADDARRLRAAVTAASEVRADLLELLTSVADAHGAHLLALGETPAGVPVPAPPAVHDLVAAEVSAAATALAWVSRPPSASPSLRSPPR